jgi:Short C-terminal domain
MVRREEWDDDQSQPEGLDDRLKKLADLHAAGELTDEEFAQAKENLLGS